MNQPLISIIIRNFNSGDALKKCILSVLSQTLNRKYLEIILIDDGSTDRSLEKISCFINNIILVQTSHVGAVNALNMGLRKASGIYYFILDSDDYLPSNSLELLINKMSENSDCALVYGNYCEINSSSNTAKLVDTKENILSTIAGGILFNLSTIKKIGFYNSKLFFPEYDLLLKIIKIYNVVHLNELVYYYVRHPNSLTANRNKVENGIKELEMIYKKKLNIRKY